MNDNTVVMYNVELADRIVIKARGFNIRVYRQRELINETTNTLTNEIKNWNNKGYYAE